MAQPENARHHFKKKTFLFRERDEEKREQFRKEIAGIPAETVVYIDEAGVDMRLCRTHARAPRGQKVFADVQGGRRQRHSMIGGWMNGRFVAPFTFKGGCGREVFNAWLEKILLPQLPRGTAVVMDNAAFHKSAQTRRLIEEAGCFLKFLPTYSPDLNPVEHCWHTLKSRLRPIIQSITDKDFNFEKLIGECLLTLC